MYEIETALYNTICDSMNQIIELTLLNSFSHEEVYSTLYNNMWKFTPIKSLIELDKIKESWHIILNPDLKESLRQLESNLDQIGLLENEISDFQDNFVYDAQKKSKVFTPYVTNSEIRNLVESSEFFAFVYNYREKVCRRRYVVYSNTDRLEKLITQIQLEIQAQEEAMKGIF